MTNPVDAARIYHGLGWNPTPIKPNRKNPVLNDWQNTKIAIEEFETRFAGMNVGVVMGRMSNHLYDADIDDQTAVKLAKHFLPKTPATFGRPGKPASHMLYQGSPADGDFGHVSFKDPMNPKITYAEIRATGHQTMMPPSVHPSGEQVTWTNPNDFTPAPITLASLTKAVGWLSAAAMMVNGWSEWSGSHHAIAGALAGGFARSQVPFATADGFIRAILMYANDDDQIDRIRITHDTYEDFRGGNTNVTGFPTLAQIIGEKRKAALIAWCALKKTNTSDGSTDVQNDIRCSDEGNARRFINMHGENLRYVHEWQSWLQWDSSRWQVDRRENVVAIARSVPDAIRNEANNVLDDDIRKALDSWSLASQNVTRIMAIPKLAKTDPRIVKPAAELDADNWLFNVQNATINLRTGGTSPFDKNDFITKKSYVVFDPRAECPLWLKYLDGVFASNAELIRFVQLCVGYTLTGSTAEQAFFIMHGPQGTGKTTFIEVLAKLFGDYGMNAEPETFMQKKSKGRATPEIAQLQGARLVTSSETEENEALAVALVKRLSGSQRITAAHLYAAPFTFDPVMKLWIDTNHKPRIPAHDTAAWARLILIPFEVEFRHQPTEIKDLKTLLYTELPGILRWAVDGCLAWQSEGLTRPDIVKQAVDDYRDESDALGQFIEDACIVEPLADSGSQQLFNAYVEWCKHANERPANARVFKQRMTERGFESKKTEKGLRWLTIRPAQERAEPVDPFDQTSPFARSQHGPQPQA